MMSFLVLTLLLQKKDKSYDFKLHHILLFNGREMVGKFLKFIHFLYKIQPVTSLNIDLNFAQGVYTLQKVIQTDPNEGDFFYFYEVIEKSGKAKR